MGQDRTFLCNFLLLLFFYRLSFSKQASNDLLRRMLLSAFFFPATKVLLISFIKVYFVDLELFFFAMKQAESKKYSLFYLKIWVFQIKVVLLQRQKVENV